MKGESRGDLSTKRAPSTLSFLSLPPGPKQEEKTVIRNVPAMRATWLKATRVKLYECVFEVFLAPAEHPAMRSPATDSLCIAHVCDSVKYLLYTTFLGGGPFHPPGPLSGAPAPTVG